jgi:hypothetical protein
MNKVDPKGGSPLSLPFLNCAGGTRTRRPDFLPSDLSQFKRRMKEDELRHP